MLHDHEGKRKAMNERRNWGRQHGRAGCSAVVNRSLLPADQL